MTANVRAQHAAPLPTATTTQPTAPNLLDELAAAPPNKRLSVLREHIKTRAARVLGLSADFPLKTGQPLNELGLDSLMAVELRNALGTLIRQTLPATVIFDHPTIDALTDYLAGKIALEGEASEPDVFDDMSDDELASLLASKLDALGDDTSRTDV